MPEDKDKEKSIAEEAGLDPSRWVPVDSEPITPGRNFPGPPAPSGRDPFASGVLPSNFGLQTDLAKTDPAPGYGTIRLVPIYGGPATNAKTQGIVKAIATTIVQEAIAAIPPPTADPVFGASGANHSAGDVPDPGATAGTGRYLCENATFKLPDGLSHGDPVWEIDSAYVRLRDDFTPYFNTAGEGGTTAAQFGELGWAVNGSIFALGQVGGAPPNMGQIRWENNGTPSNAGVMYIEEPGGSSSYQSNSWALLENPGWKVTWIFKLEGTTASTPLFDSTKKAIYIGLMGPDWLNVFNSVSRPDMFIGLRYDTSTSAPSIGDTNFMFEAVFNNTGTSAARHNTQGQTSVTSQSPAMGSWHRLDITCTTAGQVTLTLDGSATDTVTFTIPKFVVTGSASGQVSRNANILKISQTVSASGSPNAALPWAAGSVIALSGFTGGNVSANGTWTAFTATSTSFEADSTGGNIAVNSTAYTATGYPALTPCAWFGNDDTASPTQQSMAFYADFFSFVWNPNLRASGGTPNPALARYY